LLISQLGTPSSEYFPFDAIRADVLVNDQFPVDNLTEGQDVLSWFWNLFSSPQSKETISIPKYTVEPRGIDLATSLQYSPARGLAQLSTICMEISSRIYKPAYTNFTTLVHAGNTDGWAKTVSMLCNPGEGVLCDEWTYPSALASMNPQGISAVPVEMDFQGMSSTALRELLASWDADSRGMARLVISVIPSRKGHD
jgi:aromatic amino acid aminotransferase I